MSTSGYTYVQVDTGKEKIWAAAPEFKVSKDEIVTVPAGAPMKNYQSKTLNRTFDVVWFVSSIILGDNGEETKISETTAPETQKPQTCAVSQAVSQAAPDFSSNKKG